MVTLKGPQEKEYENTPASRPTPERKKPIKGQKEEHKLRKAKLVVKEHPKDKAINQGGPWITVQEKRKWKKKGNMTC